MSLSDLFDEVRLDRAATSYIEQATGPLTAPWPVLRKLGAMNVENHILGVLSRRKRQQRGFFFDRSPGMHGVRAGFEAAAAKAAGKVAALQNFGLLHGKGDSVAQLTALFRTNNFGLPRRSYIADKTNESNRAYTGG